MTELWRSWSSVRYNRNHKLIRARRCINRERWYGVYIGETRIIYNVTLRERALHLNGNSVRETLRHIRFEQERCSFSRRLLIIKRTFTLWKPVSSVHVFSMSQERRRKGKKGKRESLGRNSRNGEKINVCERPIQWIFLSRLETSSRFFSVSSFRSVFIAFMLPRYQTLELFF